MSAQLKAVPKTKSRAVFVGVSQYVDLDVEVEMSDISTDDLLNELSERDPVGGLGGIYELMAAGKRDEAYEAMRQYIMDATGRILP